MHLSLPARVVSVSLLLAAAACGVNQNNDGDGNDGDGGNDGNGASSNNGGSTAQFTDGGGDEGGGNTMRGDPTTCAEALEARTYLGCDFWPTVTANNVWSIFDYAVVVANASDEPADITVTRAGGNVATTTVNPNTSGVIYLPWVPELKGPDANNCGSATPISGTVRVPNGAYHLTSTRPVTVYQFNALEYAPEGGPPGKDWSSCPGFTSPCGLECKSYSNDASLLLPTPALTGNYRVIGIGGWDQASIGETVTVTGTENGTNVTVTLGTQATTVAGGGLNAAGPGQTLNFALQQGEVVQIYGSYSADLSGSLVQADKPVQVIHGLPCVNIPEGNPYCDHIEESVFPAETFGKRYFVTAPTGSNGQAVPYVVRIHGNADFTNLTYPGGAPANAPTNIMAGQVVDLGIVNQSFEIVGDKEFAVAMFQVGSSVTGTGLGDPSQSITTAVEQYRTKYVFLAPFDYDFNFVDIIMPMEAQVMLDGAPIAGAPTAIASGFGIARVALPDVGAGAHLITSDLPVGIQVSGYGQDTSFMYPGGLNLELIAPPPPPPQ